jgi:hypothetical protein
MKKATVLIVLISLLVISAFSAQAFTIKSVLWGFGVVTGMATVPATCTDSDSSYSNNMGIYTASQLERPDTYAAGFVNYTIPTGSTIFTDRCYNSVHLAEQFCQMGRYRGVQGITCPEGCSDGACISTTNISVNASGSCTDSDGGINSSVRGYLEVHGPGTGHSWASDCCVTPGGKGCQENGTQVMDYYCSPNSPNGYDSITLNCSNGCTQGVCFEEYRVLGPPIARETVTCMFVLPTKMPVCTSSKGSCTGALGSASTCTVNVSGIADETVTWTSDCGRNARPVTTTINGQNKNAAFICTNIRLSSSRRYGFPGAI